MDISIVILAAGQGTRMRSDLAKVLQPLAGRPMLSHVIDTARELNPAEICVVYGHGGEHVREVFSDLPVSWVLQSEQRGTGHAVQQALPAISSDNTVLIVCGDVPLVRSKTLRALLAESDGDKLAVLTADAPDPTGYGRVIRNLTGQLVEIVEEKDASDAQRAITEVNSGLMACPGRHLGSWLSRINADNAQGEYYLTDIVGCAVTDGHTVVAAKAASLNEVMGINDRRQLADAEQILRKRNGDRLLDSGVTLTDPQRVDVRGQLTCGRDVHIDINVVFEGVVELGNNVVIGPNTLIRDSTIGSGSRILSNCVIEQAVLAANCEVGPFARVRPGTSLSSGAKLGNFVEIKKAKIGSGSKVNHLTYIGDATIGDGVNVGAGTVTCNYDGANKHHTVIGENAFIGSGTMLVAPVEIGAGGTIGAGSTISHSTPPGKLVLERSKQTVISGWKRPTKEKD
jgi:bifunctional UDP-N-acetylglucosamine pyrophosphorylase/glucosamine-1-phosphate N-acetyltransferase